MLVICLLIHVHLCRWGSVYSSREGFCEDAGEHVKHSYRNLLETVLEYIISAYFSAHIKRCFCLSKGLKGELRACDDQGRTLVTIDAAVVWR